MFNASLPPASNGRNTFSHKGKPSLNAGGITGTAKQLPMLIYSKSKGGFTMLMLTPYDVARITNLPYAKALLLIKSANHIQINNRYYISETSLRAFLNPSTPMLIEEENT